MFERLEQIERQYEEIEKRLSDPSVASRRDELKTLGKQHAELGELVSTYREYRKADEEASKARVMLAGEREPEMKELIAKELEDQQARAHELEEKLKLLLIPKDPRDDKDVIVEIKAGEGGDESALFAGELFRMYQHYADARGWRYETLSSNPSDLGGLREITFAVKGKEAFSRLKNEAGVHRVQRVPETESQGRIHTSAVGVLVFPEAEEVEVDIDPGDLRIDVFRSSGPGGQSVNTTDSAVRITHGPTGISVSCQDEKSQIQNREKAMRILRARLYQMELERQMEEQAVARRSQVRSVDRSEKVRTYNFPQNRVTDHRVNKTVHNLPQVMAGDLDSFIDELIQAERAEQLQEAGR
jgi:peptide chain release factor 1